MGLMNKNRGLLSSLSSSASPPRYVRLDCRGDGGDDRCGPRKGYVPVVVGGEGVSERFLVPTQLMGHPTIAALLEMSANEFGYRQQGVLHIPCEPECFREILNTLPFKKR